MQGSAVDRHFDARGSRAGYRAGAASAPAREISGPAAPPRWLRPVAWTCGLLFCAAFWTAAAYGIAALVGG